MLNLFQHNTQQFVILKQVQDDDIEYGNTHAQTAKLAA
jgi:hypothetical protein